MPSTQETLKRDRINPSRLVKGLEIQLDEIRRKRSEGDVEGGEGVAGKGKGSGGVSTGNRADEDYLVFELIGMLSTIKRARHLFNKVSQSSPSSSSNANPIQTPLNRINRIETSVLSLQESLRLSSSLNPRTATKDPSLRPADPVEPTFIPLPSVPLEPTILSIPDDDRPQSLITEASSSMTNGQETTDRVGGDFGAAKDVDEYELKDSRETNFESQKNIDDFTSSADPSSNSGLRNRYNNASRPSDTLETTDEPTLLTHHKATQEDLTTSLSSMAHQLKLNSLHFSDLLAKDREVMEGAQGKLEGNLESMTKERGRLGGYARKSGGTTCWTIGVVAMVAMAWFFMFLLIRIT